MQSQPKHLGLARRQSYNPLSTTKNGASESLSLGTLPPPLFPAEVPTGQRSVPALDSGRRLGTNGRSPLTGEQPRTPGGSLVVGSEVFGFAGRVSGRERWGDGGLVDSGLAPDSEVVPPRTEEVVSRNWPSHPSAFENGIGTKRQTIDFSEVGLATSRNGSNGESVSSLSSFFFLMTSYATG